MSLCRDTKCPKKESCLTYRPNQFNQNYFIERMFKNDFDGFRCEYYTIAKETNNTKTFAGDEYFGNSDVFEQIRDILGIK